MGDRKIERGKILVFSAPSGAGKNTLIDHLMEDVPGLVYSISATTRAPRPGEEHGTHYFFLDKDEFEAKVVDGDFAEWELVHGNYYGTPRAFIESVVESGRHIVMDIDVFGKVKFDRSYPEAVGILIVPPSMKKLEERLRARGTEDEATISLRLDNAKAEMDFARAQGKYEHEIINDDLNTAKLAVAGLVRDITNG